MFTSPLELSAFLRRFQERGLNKGSCCSEPRVHTITKQPREYPNVVILLTVQLRRRGMKMKMYKIAQNRGTLEEINYTMRLPYIALRDQQASRAGRYLEGTCALAIRPCNR